MYIIFIKDLLYNDKERLFSFGMSNPYFLANLLNISLSNITSTAIPCTLLDHEMTMAGLHPDFKDEYLYAAVVPSKK